MKNALTRKANTVYAPYLPHAAYNALVILAKDHNAEIGKTAEGGFKATFDEVETAKNVVARWTADYEANRKVEPTPAPTKASKRTQKPKASKPTATKGKAPRKAKGEAFDFSAIKGDTNKDKNRALHATLVSMGIADSRTPEYQAVWTARPWAK